jgi:NAD(P)H-flavin reductase
MSTESILPYEEVHGDQRNNPYVIHPATIVEKIREAEDINTYRLQLVDEGTPAPISIQGRPVQYGVSVRSR